MSKVDIVIVIVIITVIIVIIIIIIIIIITFFVITWESWFVINIELNIDCNLVCSFMVDSSSSICINIFCSQTLQTNMA